MMNRRRRILLLAGGNSYNMALMQNNEQEWCLADFNMRLGVGTGVYYGMPARLDKVLKNVNYGGGVLVIRKLRRKSDIAFINYRRAA